MKRLFYLSILTSLSLTFMTTTAFAADPKIVDLIAGQHTDIGYVKVWTEEVESVEYLKVQYFIDQDYWYLRQIHLHVDGDPDFIPQTKSGSPKIGKFSINVVYQNPLQESPVYSIPLDSIERVEDDIYYIAAHAVVSYNSLEATDYTESFLPSELTEVCFDYPGPDGESYLTVTINDIGILNGIHGGWCADRDADIWGACFTADVYPSYLPDLEISLDHPENLDIVNWLLNQDFIGQPSGVTGEDNTPEDYTAGDVQWAIWLLLNDNVDDRGDLEPLGGYSEQRVIEILEVARDEGEGFLPGCGDLVLVILAPYYDEFTDCQEVLITVPLECGSETAWGGGTEGILFSDKDWSTYFTYTPEPEL